MLFAVVLALWTNSFDSIVACSTSILAFSALSSSAWTAFFLASIKEVTTFQNLKRTTKNKTVVAASCAINVINAIGNLSTFTSPFSIKITPFSIADFTVPARSTAKTCKPPISYNTKIITKAVINP